MNNTTLRTALFALTLVGATAAQATGCQIRFCDNPSTTNIACGSTAFCATGRIGDSAECNPCRTTEQGISSSNQNSAKQNQFKNGTPKSFEITFDATTRVVKYTLAGSVLSYNVTPGKKISELFIKTNSTACNTVKLDGVFFNNQAIAKQVSTGNKNTSFRIANADLDRNWTLKGNATFVWQGTPRNNEMGFAVCGTEAVPEPGSMTALAIGALTMLKRRRSTK